MKSLLAIVFASVYGLAMRLLFAFFDGALQIMSIAFLLCLPAFIGFLTVLFLPKEKVDSSTGAFFWPWVTSLALLALTILASVEGAICWIMIFPFFAVLAGIGGVIAYKTGKSRASRGSGAKKDDILDQDQWDRSDTLKMSVLLLIPAFIGLVEGERTQLTEEIKVQKEVLVGASPAAVWRALGDVEQIPAGGRRFSLCGMLGLPAHVRTEVDTLAPGGKRIATYEKGLVFDETITQCQPERRLVLAIHTDPANIPPNVMDEHIVIGGKHLDILEDVYRLEPLPGGGCRVQLSSRFVITTPFNWYAGIWARYLMADILQGELELIRDRARTGKSG